MPSPDIHTAAGYHLAGCLAGAEMDLISLLAARLPGSGPLLAAGTRIADRMASEAAFAVDLLSTPLHHRVEDLEAKTTTMESALTAMAGPRRPKGNA
jgi:hypothetical protein